MKKSLLFVFLIISFSNYSQNNEIITLYDSKGKITTDPVKVRFIQKITNKNDSLWLFRRLRRNNQLIAYWYSNNKDSKNKIGQQVTYGVNDSIASVFFYDNDGRKHGKFCSWFDNGNKKFEGRYDKGKKEGLWRHYFYSGEVAAKAFFKNDSLLNEKFYDKNGNEKVLEVNCCKIKPEFRGGIKKYKEIVQKFTKQLKYKIKGNITVDYTISIDGNLTNIRIYDVISDELSKKITTFFKSIKGWKPAIEAGREIPVQHSFTLIFE